MKNNPISPKFKSITFDHYQMTSRNLLKMKTETGFINKKPTLNLQLILKDNKSLSNHEINQQNSARSNTLQDIL